MARQLPSANCHISLQASACSHQEQLAQNLNIYGQEFSDLVAPGTTVHALQAGGAAINLSSGFTIPFPRRTCQVVLGVGGANPTVYTITGTAIDGTALTDTITAAGAGTYQGTKAFETITSLTSDVDPVGDTTLQTGNGFAVSRPFSSLQQLGVSGTNAAAASSHGPSGTVVPNASTPPDGTRDFSVRYVEAKKAHKDGPDYNAAGTIQAPSGGAPTTLTGAISFWNSAKGWYNSHIGYTGTGYAHLTADAANGVSTADMSSLATYTNAMLASLVALTTELTSDYTNHIGNVGATPHSAADTAAASVLPSTITVVTVDDVAERLNNLKTAYNSHRTNTTGVHGASDVTNVVTAANCTSADWDSMITLANDLRSKLNAHDALGAATHPGGADAVNVVTTAAITYPSGMFTLAIEFKADFNVHVASATYHNVADTVSLAYADPTTVNTLISAGAEAYADLLAHMNNAPNSGTTTSLRIVG